MKFIRWLIHAGLITASATCCGQRASEWRIYQAADGLPESLCASVTVGLRGNVWARHANEPWISRLDGFDVRVIPAAGFGTAWVYESVNGQIWSLTSDGLGEYRDAMQGWTNHPLPELAKFTAKGHDINFERVRLCSTRQNQVLLLLPQALLACTISADGGTQVTPVRVANQSSLAQFSGMTLSRDGDLWITGTRGLARIPGPARNLATTNAWREFPAPADTALREFRGPIAEDDGGVTVLVESAENGKPLIAHFDGSNWSVRANPWPKSSFAWRDGKGGNWVVTPAGLWHYENGAEPPASPEPISVHHIFDATTESNGIFWLATSDGLFRHAPLVWREPANLPDLDPAAGRAMLSESSRLWIYSGTKLARFESNQWQTISVPPEILPDPKQTPLIFPLPKGDLALCSGNQLIEFHPQTGLFSKPTDFQERLKPLGTFQNGTLCVQRLRDETNSGQEDLTVFDGASFHPLTFPQPGTNAAGEILFSYQTTNGNFWLGTGKGMARYDGTNWQSFGNSRRRISEVPSCILELGGGKIWAGVQDEIIQFDGSSWKTVRAGFFRVNGMLRARDGSVLVASENGLQRYHDGSWNINGLEEGLPSASVRGVCEDASGRIWASTDAGISLYHPDADKDAPKTYVQPLSEANTVQEGKIVSISFNGLDKWKYTSADRLLYSYRLDGQDWSRYQEQRTATFVDLSAGKHSFQVRSMDRNWNVDPSPATLAFTVTIPWYQESRLVFIASVGVAVTIFFAGLAFNRHRQLVLSHAKVEAMVELRTKQLDLANRELFHSQKMNALGTLAAGIAHDFNNILSIIKGSAQIIEDNLDKPDKIRTRTDRIRTVVDQGTGIVQAMLGFSRASDRQLTPCDINAIVQETITLLGDRFLRDVEVHYSPPASPLPEIQASKDFIQQILLNFIFNAAEAMTEKKEIILTTKLSNALPASMALKPAAATEYIFIAVTDSGSGIAPEIMPRIFEPFFTTKSLSTRRGTGLGLSMVYELALQMDCGLAVESAVGQGSTFSLIIPVREPA